MEPAKAGNDEEEEMHPVPAKVWHTTVYAIVGEQNFFTCADMVKVCLQA